MSREYDARQRPTINTLASNPVKFEVHLIGVEDESKRVVIVSDRSADLAAAIASAWSKMSAWVAVKS
jgi:hypothetical protein